MLKYKITTYDVWENEAVEAVMLEDLPQGELWSLWARISKELQNKGSHRDDLIDAIFTIGEK